MTTYTVRVQRTYEVIIEVPDDSAESLELFVQAAESLSHTFLHQPLETHDAGDAVGLVLHATNISPDGTFAYVDQVGPNFNKPISVTGTFIDDFFNWSPKPPSDAPGVDPEPPVAPGENMMERRCGVNAQHQAHTWVIGANFFDCPGVEEK